MTYTIYGKVDCPACKYLYQFCEELQVPYTKVTVDVDIPYSEFVSDFPHCSEVPYILDERGIQILYYDFITNVQNEYSLDNV